MTRTEALRAALEEIRESCDLAAAEGGPPHPLIEMLAEVADTALEEDERARLLKGET